MAPLVVLKIFNILLNLNLRGARVAAYAFLRKQQKLAKLNQIKSRYPLLLSVVFIDAAIASHKMVYPLVGPLVGPYD